MRIFHVATVADWEAAQRLGSYSTSTYGVSLAEEGFIHASRADQWRGVLERFYAEVTEPLVLLEIDTGRLQARVVEESPPATLETFPHIYGPINLDAVVDLRPLARPGASRQRSGGVSAPGIGGGSCLDDPHETAVEE